MAQHYVNTGAPFRSEKGERVERGQAFKPTARDMAMYGYKLRAEVGPVVVERKTAAGRSTKKKSGKEPSSEEQPGGKGDE